MEGLNTAEVSRVTGLKEGTVRVRLHRARLFVRKELSKGGKHPLKNAVRSKANTKPLHCRALLAALSDYMDGLIDDALCEEMDRHLHECNPYKAFLASLEDTVRRCRSYVPDQSSKSAEQLRIDLLQHYRLARKALDPKPTSAKKRKKTKVASNA